MQTRDKKNNRSTPISFLLAADADFRAAVYLCRSSGYSVESEFHMCRSRWRHFPCCKLPHRCWCSGLPYMRSGFIFQLGFLKDSLSNLSLRNAQNQPTSQPAQPWTLLLWPNRLQELTSHIWAFEHPWKSRCCWGQKLGCELDPKRVHITLYFHLAQCGKFLSSNKLQAKQLLHFFSLPLLIVCF